MQPKKAFSFLLYAGFFGFVFLLSLYMTFPVESIRPFIQEQLLQIISTRNDAAGQSSVEIKKLSLWRLSGIKLKNVTLTPAPSSFEANVQPYYFDSIAVRMGLWGMLMGKANIVLDLRAYEASAFANVKLDKAGKLTHVEANLADLNMAKLPIFKNLGVQAKGLASLDMDLDLGKIAAKEGKGILNLDVKAASIGPGELMLPTMAFATGFGIPEIRFGNLKGSVVFDKGKGNSKNLRLSGGDVEANLDVEMELSENINYSRLNGKGWFRIKPEFLEKNPKFKTLLELTPGLQSTSGDGKYEFTVQGNLSSPRFALKMNRNYQGFDAYGGSGAAPSFEDDFKVDEGGISPPPSQPPAPAGQNDFDFDDDDDF